MKDGTASQGGLDHGLEDSDKWLHDQAYNAVFSKGGNIEYVPMLRPEHEKVAFKSNCSKLRGPFGDTWGYLIPKLFTESCLELDWGLDSEPKKNPSKKKRGRPPGHKLKSRLPLPGDPDIDSGARGLVQVSETGQTLSVAWRRMQVARKLLNSYDQDKASGNYRQYLAHGNRSPSNQTLLERKTVDLSPGLSRAMQRFLDDLNPAIDQKTAIDQRVADARIIIELATPRILAAAEEFYPGAKMCGLGWHVRSGQLHCDIYGHSTKLEVVEDGVDKLKRLVRLWNAWGLSHYGPGPGMCAWDRHVRALGSDVFTVAPGLKLVVDESLERQKADYGERANRDVRLHRAVDQIFEELLPAKYRDQGMGEYKKWLTEQYAEGTVGPKLNTASKRKTALEEVLAVAAESRTLLEKKEADIKAQTLEAEKARLALAKEAKVINERELAIAKLEASIKDHAAETEKEAEVRGIKAAYGAVFPNQKPVADTVEEIVVEIQNGILGVQEAALSGVAAKEEALLVRENKIDELTRKASLWDRAEVMIKRMFELLPSDEKTVIQSFADNDSGKVRTEKVESWKGMFSRLARLVGIVKGKGDPER